MTLLMTRETQGTRINSKVYQPPIRCSPIHNRWVLAGGYCNLDMHEILTKENTVSDAEEGRGQSAIQDESRN